MTSHILFITYYLLKSYLQIIINSLKKNYFVKTLFTIPFVKKTLSFDKKKKFISLNKNYSN